MSEVPKTTGTWSEMAKPLVARFRVAGAFGMEAVHNGTGAKAIADLLEAMAERLDRAVALQLAQPPAEDLLRRLTEPPNGQ